MREAIRKKDGRIKLFKGGVLADLGGKAVADDDLKGLSRLEGMKSVDGLNLRRTNITDAGFEHLSGLENLQSLWLNNTKVTDAGVEKLQQALPNCVIIH